MPIASRTIDNLPFDSAQGKQLTIDIKTKVRSLKLTSFFRWSSVNCQVSTVNRYRGFSFIELLVVIAILGVLISLTYASFSNFQKSTKLSNAALQLKSDLRFVQNKALAGDKSTLNCSDPDNTLVGWYLEINDDASSYSLNGICKVNSSNAEDPETAAFKVLSFPYGVTADISSGDDIRVLFRPIDREVTVHRNDGSGSPPFFYDSSGLIVNPVATPFSINLISDSGTYQITIQSSGEVSEKKL